LFDFNCDVAQSYGVYNIQENNLEYEIAKYCSTINIASGFHAGDPMSIRKAFLFAAENNIAISAHIGYPDIQGFGKRKIILNDEELASVVTYQIGAIISYAKTFDLEIENVRCHGALKDELNSNEQAAIVIANSIKKITPWLNLIVQNQNTKELINSNGLKSALEFEFNSTSSIREIRELEQNAGFKIDTIHFKTLEDVKRAYDIIKPAPINYNRVQNQI